jgi:hypothetical protein
MMTTTPALRPTSNGLARLNDPLVLDDQDSDSLFAEMNLL